MKPKKLIIYVTVLLLICATHLAMASFTGSSEKKSSNMFSLKNFNKNFYKHSTSLSLKSNYTFKGFHVIGQTKKSNGDVYLQSMIRFDNGHTSYIYPYKHKVAVPKFKTPTPVNQ